MSHNQDRANGDPYNAADSLLRQSSDDTAPAQLQPAGAQRLVGAGSLPQPPAGPPEVPSLPAGLPAALDNTADSSGGLHAQAQASHAHAASMASGLGGNDAAVPPMVPLDQLHAPAAPGAVAMGGLPGQDNIHDFLERQQQPSPAAHAQSQSLHARLWALSTACHQGGSQHPGTGAGLSSTYRAASNPKAPPGLNPMTGAPARPSAPAGPSGAAGPGGHAGPSGIVHHAEGAGASQAGPSGQSGGHRIGQGEQSSDVGGVTELMRGASLTERRALAPERSGVDLGEAEPQIDAQQSTAPPSTAAPGAASPQDQHTAAAPNTAAPNHATQGLPNSSGNAPDIRAAGPAGALPSPQLAPAGPSATQPGSAGQGLPYPSVHAPALHPVGSGPVMPSVFHDNSFQTLGVEVPGPLMQLLNGSQHGQQGVNPPSLPAWGHQQQQNPAVWLGQHGIALQQVPGLQGAMVEMVAPGQQELQELPVGQYAAAAAAAAAAVVAAAQQVGLVQPGHDAAELQQGNAGAGQQPVTEAEMQQAWTQAAEAIEAAQRAAATAAGQQYGQVYMGLASFAQQHNAAQNRHMFRTDLDGVQYINGVLHQHNETWVFPECQLCSPANNTLCNAHVCLFCKRYGRARYTDQNRKCTGNFCPSCQQGQEVDGLQFVTCLCLKPDGTQCKEQFLYGVLEGHLPQAHSKSIPKYNAANVRFQVVQGVTSGRRCTHDKCQKMRPLTWFNPGRKQCNKSAPVAAHEAGQLPPEAANALANAHAYAAAYLAGHPAPVIPAVGAPGQAAALFPAGAGAHMVNALAQPAVLPVPAAQAFAAGAPALAMPAAGAAAQAVALLPAGTGAHMVAAVAPALAQPAALHVEASAPVFPPPAAQAPAAGMAAAGAPVAVAPAPPAVAQTAAVPAAVPDATVAPRRMTATDSEAAGGSSGRYTPGAGTSFGGGSAGPFDAPARDQSFGGSRGAPPRAGAFEIPSFDRVLKTVKTLLQLPPDANGNRILTDFMTHEQFSLTLGMWLSEKHNARPKLQRAVWQLVEGARDVHAKHSALEGEYELYEIDAFRQHAVNQLEAQ